MILNRRQLEVKNQDYKGKRGGAKRSEKLNFHDFKSLIDKDCEYLNDLFSKFADVKLCLPEIKSIDGYLKLLELCNKMICFDQDNPQMREYLSSILQSEQFKQSITSILAQFYSLQSDEKRKILEQYGEIFEYILIYLNPIYYEKEIKIYLNSMLKFYKMETQNKDFLQNLEKELQQWIKDQDFKMNQIQEKKNLQRFMPFQQQVIPLSDININFQNFNIIPLKEEISLNIQCQDRFSKVPTQGSYINRDIYLINNFFLLREDFFREIKQSFSRLIQKGKLELKKIDKEALGMFYLYGNTIIKSINFDRGGIFFTIITSPLFIRNKKNYKWNDSRRLMNGSLLILTNENFDAFFYLIVKSKAKNIDQQFSQSNKVTLTASLEMDNIEGEQLVNIIDQIQRFFSQSQVVIFETKYYWEAYSHFLRGIKTMIQKQKILPFENTLINCSQNVTHPAFINYNTTYTMKIDINQPNRGSNLILIRDSWNNVNKGTLDDSQFKCLTNILTKQVSIIQGPPGTDQFLKHISKFEDRIVRIGSRSQEPSLQKYLLRSIKDEYKQTKQKFHTPSLRFLKEQIEIVEELYKKITKEIEDYVLNDKDYEIYQDFTINLKELVMDSFEKFGNFDFNQKKRQVEYFELKDEIIRQWWQCKIDTKYLEKFSILTENQFKQIQIRSKEWNQKMKQEKKEYLDKLNNQRYIDIQELERQKLLEEYKLRNPLAQQEDLQKIQQEQKENEEESDDEENYFENKNEYDLEDNIKIPHFEKQAEDSYLLKVKCDENEFEELIKKLERGTLNLFKLNYSQVRNLKAYAVQYIQEDTLSKMKKSLQLYYQYQQQFKEELNQDDARILIEMKTKIIGMTLNGASINSHLLKYLKSPIIIIEEAGEVLESLLIPVLQSSTQQLILIGDHQQLKPSVNNYDLEKKYNFNTSLLERLVNNNIEFAQLNVQRRMNPEFADYIRLIYKDYQDHNDLKKVQNVRGMPSNMYLISHKQNEENIENSTSKRNIFEAKYAIKLAQYIIMQQQFNEEQITILSMYLGQCQLIRKLAKQEKMFKIKISSVDNYQGEENEIIILSLVRSNQAKKLGYTKTENRINVSFSRAKKGFYCIGNFEMIKQVQEAKLWHQIIDLAKKKQHLVESIYFKCNKHADVTKVTHFNDFDQMPKGGCKKVCNTMKGCGHSCSQTCHLDECENYKCNKPCIRQINQCSHYCQMKCYEKCKCTQQINKILNCGHQKLCLCSNDITQERCEAKVQINLICGHQKEVKCCEQQFKNHQCQKLVNMKLRCGHLKEVKCCNQAKPHECKIEVEFCCPDCKKSMLKKKCFQRETNDQCTALVNKQLKCYHFKSIPCNMKPESAKCEQEVLKQLQCGHKKKLKCFEDPSEEKNCQELVLKQLKCSHYQELKCCESIDKAKCQQQIQTQLRCGHFIEAKCSESVEQAICNQLINLRLKCGHFACNIPCKEKEDSQYKCNQLLTIQLECGHFSSHFCYEKDIPRQCIETYQNKKKCCGLTYTISCPEYQRQQYNIPECSCSNQFIICPHNINGLERQNLCDQICGIILDCGHKCQSTCSQCAFGVLHKPCKQEVIIEYNCGHKIKKECSQDPNFCSEPCQIQECLHQMKKQKKCSKTCLEKCSLQITKSKCNQCENSEWNELGCGHSFNNLDEIISQQYQKNPFRSPECLICQQPINILKYKIILKDVKINQYFFSKGIKNKVKQIISDFSISDQQFQEISKEYIVFEKSAQLFDKFRMCYLYQSIKYLKELQKHYISIDNQDQETQKILNTIKLQVKILEQTYLKENQKNLGINQIRKFVNTIIFLTGMFYQFMEYNTKSLQLKQFNVYQMPSEPDYNSVVYQVFQYNQAFQLHMITNNLWQSPILAPTQTSICPNNHISQLEDTKCRIQACNQNTSKKQFYLVTPQ